MTTDSLFILNEKLAILGQKFTELNDEKHKLQDNMKLIKDGIEAELKALNVNQCTVVAGTTLFKFKLNKRSSKSFDKQGFGAKIGEDPKNLDYVGMAEVVMEDRADKEMVRKFQKTNTSEFITVRSSGCAK